MSKSKDLIEALEMAILVIQNYEVDIRAANDQFGIDLVEKGFCQGQLYKNAVSEIRKKAGIKI